MDVARFRASLIADVPQAGLSPALLALWWAAKGDWNRAHKITQIQDDQAGAWVHAYLHRVEGDLSNAGYWYRCADRPATTEPLESEWITIVEALLTQKGGG